MQRSHMEFDFDRWSRLAREDPEAFEALRRAALDEVIHQAPEGRQPALRALQWRIDQERRRAKTPLAACIRISRMMWERVMGDGGLLEQLQTLNAPGMEGARSAPRRCPAAVVPLRR